MKIQTQPTPLVCDMTVFTSVERENHIQTTAQLFQSVQDIHEIATGYEFVFPSSDSSEIIIELAEFISDERRCCPFLEFTLKISLDKPISLLLTGPEGTRAFLREEFNEVFS